MCIEKSKRTQTGARDLSNFHSLKNIDLKNGYLFIGSQRASRSRCSIVSGFKATHGSKRKVIVCAPIVRVQIGVPAAHVALPRPRQRDG